MGLIGFIVLLCLLWIVGRNANEVLGKQTAMQYEIASINKKLDELLEKSPD